MSTFMYGANVHANGIRQHYLRFGGQQGERKTHASIVIIPGITSPAVTWAFVGERFGLHYDTYILDVRGRGLSEAGATLDYSLDAQSSDVIEFARALELKDYIIVGHSMGARIGARAAAAQPAGLSRLVMVDPPVSGPGRRAYPSKLPWYVDSMALARKGCSAQDMKAFCPTWTEEQLRLRAQWLHTCDERAVVESFEGFHTDDVLADFPKIRVPVLLVTAARGDVVLPEDVKEIEGLIGELAHVRVDNAGHMIPWDNEEGFYKAFGQFLGQHLTRVSQAC